MVAGIGLAPAALGLARTSEPGKGRVPDASRRSFATDVRTAASGVKRAHRSSVAAHRALLRRLAGAKIMVPMSGTFPDRWLLTHVRDGEIGGVIIFAENVSSHLHAAVAALQRAASSRGGHPLLIATDQEGGTVKRLPHAPPEEPASEMTPAIAYREGLAATRALKARGVNTDLAPVADVEHPGSFLGTRSFSGNPTRVAEDACRFAAGLEAGGVNATFKHFPGLGAALTSTDEAVVRIDLSEPQLLRDLAAYRRCSPAMVMVSSAIYPALDRSEQPAVFSSKIVTGLLRDRLHFDGVTMSDTLNAPAASVSNAAVRATNAGVDVLLYTGEEHEATLAMRQILRGLAHGELSQRTLEGSDAPIWRIASGR